MSAIEKVERVGALVSADEWDRERIELVKRTYCKGATDDELALFVATAQRTGLSPEARQIFAVKRWDRDAGREVMSTQTSIDGYRLIAQRSNEYAGQIPKQWCGEDGRWVDVWLKSTPPAAAKAGVYRQGFAEPLVAIATYAEYVQTKKDGKPTAMWASKPALMLAKCAEALALRAAFPAELSGLYTAEEMGQAENDLAPVATMTRPHARGPVRDTADPTAPAPARRGPRKPPNVTDDGEIVDAEVVDEKPRFVDNPAGESKREPRANEAQVADITDVIAGLKEAGGDWADKGRARWKAAGLPSVPASNLSEDQAAVAYEVLAEVYREAVAHAQPTLDDDPGPAAA